MQEYSFTVPRKPVVPHQHNGLHLELLHGGREEGFNSPSMASGGMIPPDGIDLQLPRHWALAAAQQGD